jgi:hypothetical protein
MKQSEFLITSIQNCEANLAKPNVRYPNGRMSHDVEAEHREQLVEQWHDYCIDKGLYDAYGNRVGFEGEDGRWRNGNENRYKENPGVSWDS